MQSRLEEAAPESMDSDVCQSMNGHKLRQPGLRLHVQRASVAGVSDAIESPIAPDRLAIKHNATTYFNLKPTSPQDVMSLGFDPYLKIAKQMAPKVPQQ